MAYFAGTPEWVRATVWQNGREATPDDVREGDEHIGWILGDRLHAVYGFPNGVVGPFESRKGGNRFGNRSMGLHIIGTEGVLACRGGYLLHYPHPCWTPVPNDSDWRVIEAPAGHSVESLNAPLVRDLLRAVEEDGSPLTSGDGARWALEMILGVYAAYRYGRVPLPLADREHPLRDWVAR
jgi:hypothetical protein